VINDPTKQYFIFISTPLSAGAKAAPRFMLNFLIMSNGCIRLLAGAKAAPHFMQNLLPSLFSAPHL
jgi:hypothetical protein